MKVICIKNKYKTDSGEIRTFNITVGKIYNVLCCENCLGRYFVIVDDDGNKKYLSERYVITLEEYRNKQIDKIINNN